MTEDDSITDLVPTQKYHKTLYAFARRMISATQRTGMLKGCSLIGPIAFTIYFVVVTSTNVTSPMQRNLSLIYKGELEHKNLIPLNDSDIIGSLFVILGLMMAASGGIGGGGILVPLLIIIFEFNPKHAVPLSNFTILGSSVTNILMNLSKRHPNADRPLIDWDMILVMEPLTMAGAIIGTLVGKMIPDWLLVSALVALLAYISVTTLLKAKSQYNSESGIVAFEAIDNETEIVDEGVHIGKYNVVNKIDADEENSVPSTDVIIKSGPVINPDFFSVSLTSTVESENQIGLIGKSNTVPAVSVDKLIQLIEEEKKTPLNKIILLILLVTVVVGLNMLKGGGGSGLLGIECGSPSYWCITALELSWMCIISLWIRSYLINKWKLKQSLKYCFISGDIEWNERNTLIYPSICFFAGFFSGMFGIGGGIVKGPLMLQMGVHPLVAAATTAVMITFTSTAATTMFVAFGTLTWDYAGYFFFLGLISTFVGQVGVGYFINKYKRYSFITISIGLVVLISTILVAIESVYSILDSQNGIIDHNFLCHN